MAWTDYAAAPAPGTRICAAADLVRVLSLSVEGARGALPVQLVRRAAGVSAFVNACPHQYLPLDYRGPQVLSADGARLLCTSHGASFCAESGAPLSGLDCGLDAIPVEEVAGEIRVAAG